MSRNDGFLSIALGGTLELTRAPALQAEALGALETSFNVSLDVSAATDFQNRFLQILIAAHKIRAQRTSKGSGAMFSFDLVAAFIDDFETAFDRIRDYRTKASPNLVKGALETNNDLRLLIQTPGQTQDADGARIIERLAIVTPFLVKHLEATSPEVPPAAAPTIATCKLAITFDYDILVKGSNPSLCSTVGRRRSASSPIAVRGHQSTRTGPAAAIGRRRRSDCITGIAETALLSS